MPAAYAHDIAALSARRALGDACPAWLQEETSAYLLGAQGPDIFFYYGILPPFRHHRINLDGLRLHAQSGAIWGKALLRAAKALPCAARAWALGYLCHWSVDAACHPYVLAREGEKEGAHGLIEMGADTLLFQRDGGATVPKHLAYVPLLGQHRRRAIAELFARTFALALPGRAMSQRQGMHAISDAHRLYSYLYSPDGKRFRWIQRIDRLLGKEHFLSAHLPPLTPQIGDPLNLSHKPWGQGGRTDSLPELLEEGAARAAEWIRMALGYWQGTLGLEQALALMGNLRMRDGLSDGGPDSGLLLVDKANRLSSKSEVFDELEERRSYLPL